MMTISTLFNNNVEKHSDVHLNNTGHIASVYSGEHKGLPIFFQRAAAILALIALSPVYLTTMLLIALESKGGCFFSQDRIGRYGRHFKMYKFRSMYLKADPKYREPDPTDSDRDGVCKKYKKDPRITKVGAFIRKFSIDELPQLLNIARGDMTLVGPRPALAIEVDEYPSDALSRLNGMPGLSGLWQVSGRADTDFATQVELDDQYLSQQSIWLDVKIILATIPCVLAAKGAY